MKKVICIGELLIDFICKDVGKGLVEGREFIKKAGGAPANVCAAISKLGGDASFLGKVGNDSFGLFLKKTLDDAGVDTTYLILDEVENTTLAFVSLQEDGERDFIFNRGADENLYAGDINYEDILKAEVIHFGSATALLGGFLKETYIELLKLAKERGNFISFDPNYRVDLWKGNEAKFIEDSKFCLKYADFVKVSEEELFLISGRDTLSEGVEEFHKAGAKIVAVTLGSEGTVVSNQEDCELIKSIKIKSVDSTGAGDAFVGAVLYKIAEENLSKTVAGDFSKLQEIISFSNKVGAITCTKMGAIDALPELKDIG